MFKDMAFSISIFFSFKSYFFFFGGGGGYVEIKVCAQIYYNTNVLKHFV